VDRTRISYWQLSAAAGWTILMIIGSSIPSIPREVAPLFAYDKILHFIEYAGFAWLWGLLARAAFPGMLRGRIWLMIILLGAVWGALDEVYQGMIGRSRDPFDWVADTVGVCVAQAVQEWLARREGRGK
jgi:VanZ family protein